MGMNDTPSGANASISAFSAAMPGNRYHQRRYRPKSVHQLDTQGTTSTLFSKAMEFCPCWDGGHHRTGIDDVNGASGRTGAPDEQIPINKTDIAVVIVDGTEGLATADEDVVASFRVRAYLIVYK